MPVHARLRPFNTRDTYPEQKLDNDLCQVVVARGTMVFVRGQVGQDLDAKQRRHRRRRRPGGTRDGQHQDAAGRGRLPP